MVVGPKVAETFVPTLDKWLRKAFEEKLQLLGAHCDLLGCAVPHRGTCRPAARAQL